jgi:hypothetical protein
MPLTLSRTSPSSNDYRLKGIGSPDPCIDLLKADRLKAGGIKPGTWG